MPDTEQGHLEDAAAPTPEDARVEALLGRTIDVPVLASAVSLQEAADAADTLEQLGEDEAADVLERMEEEAAAQALAEMQRPLAAGVLEDVAGEDPALAARLLHLMAPDDAADLLQAVEDDRAESLLAALPARRAAGLRALMGYDEESAGGLMTTDFLALRTGMTVSEGVELVRRRRLPESVNDLPVIDGEGKLVGLVTLRDLLVSAPDDRIAALMHESVRVLRPEMDREAVANEFDRYDHTMLPVADDRDHLLGVVTVDDVIDIIRAEHTEDVQMTVGAGPGEAVYSGLLDKLRGRFPWLGTSLVLTMMAAMVILVFEDLIAEHRILAFLLPVIAAVVGNAGHQALAVTLRGLVLDEVRGDLVFPLVLRESAVGLFNGAALGVLVFVGVGVLTTWMGSSDWQLGAVAGISLMAAMTVGTVAGSSVPLLMRRLGVDPAHASAIFLIMITDAVSFSILLALVALLF